MIYTYGLLDVEGRVRYVGRTKHLWRRYRQHMEPSRLRHKTKVACWIRSLLTKGDVPRITILSVGDREADYIKALRRNNLMNLTDGGEGATGWTPTAEWRRKHSDALRGKPKSPEHRAKLAAHCLRMNAAKKGLKRGPQAPEHVAKRIAAMKHTLASRRTNNV